MNIVTWRELVRLLMAVAIVLVIACALGYAIVFSVEHALGSGAILGR